MLSEGCQEFVPAKMKIDFTDIAIRLSIHAYFMIQYLSEESDAEHTK